MENISKFLALFFVLSFFLAACGQTQQVTTDSGMQEKSQDSGSVSSESAKDVIADVISGRTKTFMVAYQVTGAGESNEMTMFVKDKKFRYDSGTGEEKGSIFFVDGKVYSCSYNPEMCVEFGDGEEPPSVTEEIESNLEGYNVMSKPDRTIAGAKAKCFGVGGTGTSVEVCYSEKGVPLYTKSEADGQVVEMVATEYSTSVSDSTFELPADPQDLEAMMAQQQAQMQ